MTATLPVPARSATGATAFAVRADCCAMALLALFAADNLLLLRFLGLPAQWITLLAVPIVFGIVHLTKLHAVEIPRIPIAVLGYAMLISLGLFLLGGEGRFFYANADWQIRDAILRDMSTQPWPYAYALEGRAAILRAPIGMYLMPSLAGGKAHEIALLLSNSIRLALLISLAWLLFDSRKKRVFALCVFFVFSGWDIVGTVLYANTGKHVSWDHLEQWNFGLQYSSHITQAFWVPQHALAGWASALMFVLWRKGLAPIGWFAATVPLVALWSPLAIMGAIPFALLAGTISLLSRRFDWRDILLAMLAVAVSLPALLYLQIDAAKLGSGILRIPAPIYIILVMLEVAPFIILPLLDRRNSNLERLTLWTILLCLLLMPFWKIGIGKDFQMRASIMPLALLALAFAEWFIRSARQPPRRNTAVGLSIIALGLGAVTPLLELHRSLVNGPSPAPRCSLLGAWHQQSGMVAPYAAYLADAASFPGRLKNVPAHVGRNDPPTCWDSAWHVIEAPRARTHTPAGI